MILRRIRLLLTAITAVMVGSPGEYSDFIRCAAPRVFARQSASGSQDESLGGGGLPQQSLEHKRAHLALDYERGRSARVGYLTNQPRTIGVGAQYKF
jgi:hypothetical protein